MLVNMETMYVFHILLSLEAFISNIFYSHFIDIISILFRTYNITRTLDRNEIFLTHHKKEVDYIE